MKNYRQTGSTMNVLLAATVASGAVMVVGALVVVAEIAGVSGDTIAVKTDGVYELAKGAGALSQGAKLYWDDTAKVVTTSAASGANLAIGYVFSPALNGDTTVEVLLNR